jgi:hypothetical protein
MGGAPPPPPGAPELSVFCIEIPYINLVLEFPIKRKRDLGTTLCEKGTRLSVTEIPLPFLAMSLFKQGRPYFGPYAAVQFQV